MTTDIAQSGTGGTPAFAQRLDEGAKAFQAFRIYRELPPRTRSVTAAYRASSGRSEASAPGTWRAWCSKFDWPERAAAYDAHLDQVERAAVDESRAEDARMMHDTGRGVLALSAKRLLEMLRDEPGKVSPHAAVKAIEVGAMLITESHAIGAGRRALPEGIAATLDAIVVEFGERALSGDADAARVVIDAARRMADATGTDAPSKHVGVEVVLQRMMGDKSPDDIPDDLRQQLMSFYRSRRPIRGYIPTGPGWAQTALNQGADGSHAAVEPANARESGQ